MACDAAKILAVLTRPQGRNEPLAGLLDARGIQALVLPALHIRGTPLKASGCPRPADYDLVVFVSGTAARLYCRQLTAAAVDWRWPDRTFAATVGQASAQALYSDPRIAPAHILYPDARAGRHDSEALWSVLRPMLPNIQRVLIVRGQGGRDWLAYRLRNAGCHVDKHEAYRRTAQHWTAAQARLLETGIARANTTVCLVTSGQSADAIHENVERWRLATLWEQVRFVTIHPRIATRLQSLFASGAEAGSRRIALCSPHDAAIAQAIEVAASQ
jgi:uroporphyrinogen-III synthase